MSLKETIVYEAQCDCCGDSSGETFPDPGDAVEGIPDDWVTIEAKQLCAQCWDWGPETPWSDQPIPLHCHEVSTSPVYQARYDTTGDENLE